MVANPAKHHISLNKMTGEQVFGLSFGASISFYAILDLIKCIKRLRKGSKEWDSIFMYSFVTLVGSSMIFVVFTWVISTTYLDATIIAECDYDDEKKGIQYEFELDGEHYTNCVINDSNLDLPIGKTVRVKVNGIFPSQSEIQW